MKIKILTVLFLCFLFISSQAQPIDSVKLYDSIEYIEKELPPVEVGSNKEYPEVEEDSASTLYFKHNEDDTAKVVARFNISNKIEEFKKDKDFIYPPRFTPKKEKKEEKKEPQTKPSNYNFPDLSGLEYVVWGIIIIFLITILYYYFKENGFNVISRKSKSIATTEDEIDYENIFDINYNKQITNAEELGNYNLAARLIFLRILTQLSDRKIIQYGIEKTNFDYQFQLINTKYYQPFVGAAFCFDYVWYGGSDITYSQYMQIKEEYKKLEALI